MQFILSAVTLNYQADDKQALAQAVERCPWVAVSIKDVLITTGRIDYMRKFPGRIEMEAKAMCEIQHRTYY